MTCKVVIRGQIIELIEAHAKISKIGSRVAVPQKNDTLDFLCDRPDIFVMECALKRL